MIYFLVDPEPAIPRVKIGYTAQLSGVRSRFNSHRTGNADWRFYCAIEGQKQDEDDLHKWFRSAAANGAAEIYRLTPELQDYLEWLGEQPWAACSFDEVLDPYAHWAPEIRWPWQAYRASTKPPARLTLFTEDFGPIRGPLPPSERGSAFLRDSNDWYTPLVVIESARVVMGQIDLDPASSWAANRRIRAASIYTKNEDGLAPSNPWAGNVWLNPPYGGQQAAFVRRLVAEYTAGNVTQAVACLNGTCFETRWFQPLFDFPVCFSVGRIRFEGGASSKGPKTEENNAPKNATAFVYLGPNRRQFVEEFTKYGNVLQCEARYRGTYFPDDEDDAA